MVAAGVANLCCHTVFHVKRGTLVENASQLYRDLTRRKKQSCMHQLTNAAVCTNVTWRKRAIVHASITHGRSTGAMPLYP
jgi:hypothetical protein